MDFMTLEQVVRYLQEGALLLRFAIDTGVFPEPLLHTFACDCAQRALLWERHVGLDSHKSCWKATGVKRLWIEGDKSDKELSEIHLAVRKIAEETDSAAAWAATWASSDTPMLAARCSAHYGSAAAKPKGKENPTSFAWNLEKLWQKDRFLWLTQAWQECGDETPNMLREGTLPFPETELVALNSGIGS